MHHPIVTPSGEVTSISNLYPGYISDKEIACKIGLLNKTLLGEKMILLWQIEVFQYQMTLGILV